MVVNAKKCSCGFNRVRNRRLVKTVRKSMLEEDQQIKNLRKDIYMGGRTQKRGQAPEDEKENTTVSFIEAPWKPSFREAKL